MSETIINVYGDHAAIVPDDRQTHYDFGVADERERILSQLRPLLNAPDCFVLDLKKVIALVEGATS